MSLLERDEAARQLNHREVVLRESLPTDEQPAKTVVPTVGALDDPAPRPAAHAADERLLASSTDVRADPTTANGGFRVDVVVAFVQAQIVWTSRSARRSNHDRVEYISNHPFVVYVGSGDQRGQRNPSSVGENVTFHPEFRAVRRVRPRVAPPFGALAMALSSEAKSHLIPRRLS